MEMNITTETQNVLAAKRLKKHKNRFEHFVPFCGYLFLFLLLSSCGSKPTDLRSVIPADALVYLEANDLGKTLSAIIENKTFLQLAKSKPDLSAFDGIKIAVAVTGFEGSEQQVTEDRYIGKFTPRFVAAVETNAWNFQAVSFTENKIGEFINEVYGGSVELETSDKHGGKYFVWTSQDGRKAYALVQGSVIFFGNDESAIEKCLAVRRGEADSINKNSKITSGDPVAFGYISTDGIAQIASLAGATLANSTGEEADVQSFIARVLPEIIRGSLQDVVWTATKNERGIEDTFTIAATPEVSKVLAETLGASESVATDLADFIPADALSTTRYNLSDPQIAWRSVLLTAQMKTDAVSGKLIGAFAESLFEPYGIENAEMFLSAVGPQIQTGKFDTDGDNVVVVTTVKDVQTVKNAIAKEIDFSKTPEKLGTAEMWWSEDGEISAAFVGQKIILGDSESVLKCLQAQATGTNFTKSESFKIFSASSATSVTIGKDGESGGRIVEILAGKKEPNATVSGVFSVETRFGQSGIERRMISDFGLIGSLIEQFGKEQ